MSIKLEMLRVFRVTAERGSLAAAADSLGRTPSAVSMMLAQLEADIGAPLFETDRKNRLSPLGQMVLAESARATDAFGRSVAAIRRHAASAAGTVRIAAVPSATVTVLPGVIAAFRSARPDVRIEVSDTDSQTVSRWILLDEADIGIISAAGAEDAEGAVILEDDLGIACLAQGAIAQHVRDGAAPSWALLQLEPLIANPLCHLVRHPAVKTALAACNLEARNTSALLSFLRAGLGATVLPRGAMQGQAPDLLFLAPADPAARRALRKIANPDRRFSPAVDAFWSTLGA